MHKKSSGHPIFTFFSSKKKYYKLGKVNLRLSLLAVLIGIFLLPNLAYLAGISPEKLIELTNQERQAAGLNNLTANQLLTQAAILKGRAIIENNAFRHTINDKKFSSWIRQAGYNYSYVGENLAIDFSSNESIMEAWKNSPLHKKNLLSPYYEEIGISAISGKFQAQDTVVVIQIFGAPGGGLASALAQAENFNLNPETMPEQSNLIKARYLKPENLLTRAIINQEAWPPYNYKIALPSYYPGPVQVNKLIIQSNYYSAFSHILITASLLFFIYLIIYLYYYFFFKLNKIITAQF